MTSSSLKTFPLSLQKPFLCSTAISLHNVYAIPSSLKLYSTHSMINAITLDELPPNALRRKRDPQWRGGFSLGVDLGMARTGIALSKGFTVRPLTVKIQW